MKRETIAIHGGYDILADLDQALDVADGVRAGAA
jgi:hypothetical protein